MIVDLVVRFFADLFRPVIDTLPQGHLSLPGVTGLGSSLAGLDSLVPVLGVLRLGAVMLSALVLFVVVRVVVFVRYLLLP